MPAEFAVAVTGPAMVLAEHAADPLPIRTKPVLCWMVTAPLILVPHTVTATAPEAEIGPVTVASTSESAPPDCTVIGPLI
jgi:hypothetical protein